MKQLLRRVFSIAFITFFLGVSIDYLSTIIFKASLENQLGLDTLFKIRGVRPAPNNIVIIAMDETSESNLGLGNNLPLWRQYHAQLIHQLQAFDVRLVVFDLQFMTTSKNIDQELANAIHATGNVILTNCVQKFVHGNQDFYGREDCSDANKQPIISTQTNHGQPLPEKLVAAHQIPPISIFRDTALDHSPFFLTYDAENETVRESWLFYDILGDTPSLPLTAWLYSLKNNTDFVNIKWLKPPFSVSLTEQRLNCLVDHDQFALQINKQSALEQQIFDLLCQDDSRYLNYYGPPQTIRMESYSDVLDKKVMDLQDKIVFIGKASRQYTSGRTDVFPTPFANSNHGKMSGLEIMATQFANLQQNNFITTPVSFTLSLLIYAFIITLSLSLFSGLFAIILSLLLNVIYTSVTIWCFNRYAWWLPIAVPFLFQYPAVLVFTLWDSLTKWQPTSTNRRTVNSVCLATDIVGSTSVSEMLATEKTSYLLDSYHQALSNDVHKHYGKINDLIADSMMAYWLDLPIKNQHLFACLAALDILETVDKFNANSSISLPIRIGLNEGEIMLRTISTGETLLYRGIGNTLNIASRIEGVNKLLGTRILAAKSITDDLFTIHTRNVGSFCLLGSKKPIDLVEVIGKTLTAKQVNIYQDFAEGLNLFQQANWQNAAISFQTLLETYGFDGPSDYYLSLALAYIKNPPVDWAGFVHITTK